MTTEQQIESKQEQKQKNGTKRNKKEQEEHEQQEKQEWRGEKVPYHRGGIIYQNDEFCASKLESTTGTMTYTYLDRVIFISIQTNVAQIYVPSLEWSFAQELVWKAGAEKIKDKVRKQILELRL